MKGWRVGWILLCWFNFLYAQEFRKTPFFFYPSGQDHQWKYGAGATFTTTPRSITEEIHTYLPAIDFHFLKGINENLVLRSRIRTQVLQNELWMGLQFVHPLGKKFSFGFGNDFSPWFGFLKLEGFNTKAFGFLNYPNISLGYQFDDHLYLTLKAEVVLNLYEQFYAGEVRHSETPPIYCGEALGFCLEQPFYKKTWIGLGFRALYTDFYWQTWSLFETFNRNIFYPELSFMLIL